jgi:hypothetical protein
VTEEAKTAKAGGPSPGRIEWDDSQMKSSYANVCNVNGTREEVVLLFGISNPAQGGDARVRVQLSDRIILSPHAAKRLAQLLGSVVDAYESRFGVLETSNVPRQPVVPQVKN